MVPDGHSEFAPTPTSPLIREIELRNGVSYDVAALLDYVAKNTRVASVRARMEGTREAL